MGNRVHLTLAMAAFVALLALVNWEHLSPRRSPYGLFGASTPVAAPPARSTPETGAEPPAPDWLVQAETALEDSAGLLDPDLSETQIRDLTARARAKAETGDAAAMARLASLYFAGLGVPKDTATSTTWLKRAAEAGHARSQYRYGMELVRAASVVGLDATAYPPGQQPAVEPVFTDEALRWLKAAAQNGDGFSRSFLEARGIAWNVGQPQR